VRIAVEKPWIDFISDAGVVAVEPQRQQVGRPSGDYHEDEERLQDRLR
jgi:hypothetical protein